MCVSDHTLLLSLHYVILNVTCMSMFYRLCIMCCCVPSMKLVMSFCPFIRMAQGDFHRMYFREISYLRILHSDFDRSLTQVIDTLHEDVRTFMTFRHCCSS